MFAAVAAGQLEESVESKGVILSLEQDTATVSLEVAGSVKEGDRVRIDRINDEDEVIRGEIIEIRETDAIVNIDTAKLEIGQNARIFSAAPVVEADILASIPDDKFSLSDTVDDDKIDRKAALKACLTALTEFPEEPRFHAQLGRLLEVLEKPASAILSYERALVLEPSYPVVLHKFGSLRFFGPEELRDLEVARDFYRRAAELEFDAAMPVIGSMSRDASGGPQDYEAAVHWFKIAADKGNL